MGGRLSVTVLTPAGCEHCAVLSFFILLFFHWSTIVLQCCVGFCCMTALISYKYASVPSPLSFPPISPIPPLLVTTAHRTESPRLYIQQFHTHCVYRSMPLSQFIPSSPSPTASTSLFSIFATLFLPCK